LIAYFGRLCRVVWVALLCWLRAGGGVKIKMRGNTTNRSIDEKRGGMFTINCVAFRNTFTEILMAEKVWRDYCTDSLVSAH
jgi:hypothetical protein